MDNIKGNPYLRALNSHWQSDKREQEVTVDRADAASLSGKVTYVETNAVCLKTERSDSSGQHKVMHAIIASKDIRGVHIP